MTNRVLMEMNDGICPQRRASDAQGSRSTVRGPPRTPLALSVTAIRIVKSASATRLTQILWPLITHWSPSCSAWVFIPAGSPPAPGSEIPIAETFSPRQIPMIGGLYTYEIVLEDCRVPASKLLGQEGDGFAPMQLRLSTRRVQIASWCEGQGSSLATT
jgi:hypothetical protein